MDFFLEWRWGVGYRLTNGDSSKEVEKSIWQLAALMDTDLYWLLRASREGLVKAATCPYPG